MFAYEMAQARIADLQREADHWRLAQAAKDGDGSQRQVTARRGRGDLRVL